MDDRISRTHNRVRAMAGKFKHVKLVLTTRRERPGKTYPPSSEFLAERSNRLAAYAADLGVDLAPEPVEPKAEPVSLLARCEQLGLPVLRRRGPWAVVVACPHCDGERTLCHSQAHNWVKKGVPKCSVRANGRTCRPRAGGVLPPVPAERSGPPPSSSGSSPAATG